MQGALIQAWELTLRSPHLWRYGQAHLAYSNQIAQQIGGITGGLVCYGPSALPADCLLRPPGYSALDHDQRNTLNLGFNGNLPWRIYGSFNVYYGSGFSNGYQDPPSPYSGPYLPSHTTADLALGSHFGESYTVSINASTSATPASCWTTPSPSAASITTIPASSTPNSATASSSNFALDPSQST